MHKVAPVPQVRDAPGYGRKQALLLAGAGAAGLLGQPGRVDLVAYRHADAAAAPVKTLDRKGIIPARARRGAVDIRTVRERLSTPIDPPACGAGAAAGPAAAAADAAEPRPRPRLRPAAVLVAICAWGGSGAEPTVLMTRKRKGLRVHAGEISFPGGKPEPADADLLDTALRETREEVNLDVGRGQVVGQLDPVSTAGTGFSILPFAAVLEGRVRGGGGGPGAREGLRAEAGGEVDEIIEFPLGPLLATMSADCDPAHRSSREAPVFSLGGRTVWGASARILGQVARMLGSGAWTGRE